MSIADNVNKKTEIILIISIIIIGLFSLIVINNQKPKIGGGRENYGCLVSADYSWNGSIGACIKEQELDESQRQAAKLAVAPLSFPVTVVEVQTLRCFGCFIVTLQRNDNRNTFQIRLSNWTHIGDCKDYPYHNCPDICMVCPSCESCNSVSCQTEESCKRMGFDREWYENKTQLLNSINKRNLTKKKS